MRLACIDQPEHEIGLLHSRQSAPDPLRLDRAVGLPDPGRVGDDHRQAAEVEMNLDGVAGRARLLRNDCRVAPRQRVEEARLADIGRAAMTTRKPSRKSSPRRSARCSPIAASSLPTMLSASTASRARRPHRRSRARLRSRPRLDQMRSRQAAQRARAPPSAAPAPAAAAPPSRRRSDRRGPRPR